MSNPRQKLLDILHEAKTQLDANRNAAMTERVALQLRTQSRIVWEDCVRERLTAIDADEGHGPDTSKVVDRG